MIRRMILAAALAISAQPAIAQDSLVTSTAPAPTLVRLPLVRLIADGDRVVMQVMGSTLAQGGAVDGYYVGPDGYTANIAAATDVRGEPGGTATANPTPGPPGAPGKSAYQAWLDRGNEGTETAFVASLRGQQGVPGGTGPAGAPGQDGRSAYQLWLDAGNSGSAADFLASLAGAPGAKGGNGTNGINGVDGAPAEMRSSGGFIQWRAGNQAWANLLAIADLVGAAGPQGPAGTNGVNGQPGSAATVSIGSVATGAPGAAATVTNGGTSSAAILNFTIPAGQPGANGGIGATGATPNIQLGNITTLAAGASASAALRGTAASPILDLGLPAGAQGIQGVVGPIGATGASGPVGATGATGPSGALFLNNITLTQTAVIALALGPRQLTVATNCIVGDRLVMTPLATMPAGYMLGDIFCSANGTALATLYAPLLAIGANYSIVARVIAFR